MLYRGMVIDNKDFYTTGKIRVKLKKNSLTNYSSDLGADGKKAESILKTGVSKKKDGKYDWGSHSDCMAYVYSPLGAGLNFGLFFLPQANTEGVVAILDDDGKTAIWIGSFFVPEFVDGVIETLNIPNDIDTEEDLSGISGGGPNLVDKDCNSLIIRTRTNKFDRSLTGNDLAKSLSWAENLTENLIVLNKKGVKIRHYSNYDKATKKPSEYESIYIKTEPGINSISTYKKQNDIDSVPASTGLNTVDVPTIEISVHRNDYIGGINSNKYIETSIKLQAEQFKITSMSKSENKIQIKHELKSKIMKNLDGSFNGEFTSTLTKNNVDSTLVKQTAKDITISVLDDSASHAHTTLYLKEGELHISADLIRIGAVNHQSSGTQKGKPKVILGNSGRYVITSAAPVQFNIEGVSLISDDRLTV